MTTEEGGSGFGQPIEVSPDDISASGVTASEEGVKSQWDRRTFFKAAALGTAAAAMYEGGRAVFSPVVAYADNLSSLNCTANDVRMTGPAIILNEPCACTGTFNAQVQFSVFNNAAATRYCVTVHFCPVTLPDGTIFDLGDVKIADEIAGKTTQTYTVPIANYPCGTGLLCFGAAGPDPDGGFPKGAACPPGACCTTISWDVNPGCPSRVISSKCRHQQVCIQGRGRTTLDCDISAIGTQTNCPVECGATTTVRLCTTEAASFGPFTFVLHVPGQPDQTFTGPGPCHDFTVGPITDTTTVTGDVTSNDGCTKSASVTLTTSPISVSLDVSGEETCNSGVLEFTATLGAACPAGGQFQFSVDGAIVQPTPTVADPNPFGADNTYTYPADPDGTCHTVSVIGKCGACVSEADSITVSQCVTTTTGCTP